MRLAPLLLAVAASAAASQSTPRAAAKGGPAATLVGPRLQVRDSLVIDATKAKLESPISVAIGPAGRLIAHMQYGRVMAAFDSAGRRLWMQQRQRRDVGEMTAIGWKGSDMWISDASYSQIAVMDSYGNVQKSLELPSWVRPSFSNRKAFPVFESMRVFAIYEDGSMLVVPRSPMSLVSTPSFDRNSTYIFRINEEGIIQKMLARFPATSIRIKNAEGGEITADNAVRGHFRIASDGSRIVVVTTDTASATHDTIRVAAINERGDTVYRQKFAQPARFYGDTEIDSIARTRYGNEPEYRERHAKGMTRRAPAVNFITLDYDKSVWITLRQNGATQTIVGIDAAGKAIGSLQLPATTVVRAADRGRLWVGDTRSGRRNLVRYSLTPAR